MQHFIGIDVGKNLLFIHDTMTSKDFKVKNDTIDITFFFNQYTAKNVTIVLEPTGCYHQKLLRVLNDLGIDYFLIPLDVIDNLNKILGESNKNDTLDARKIAQYGKIIADQQVQGTFKIRTVSRISNDILKLKAIYSQLFSMEKLLSKTKQLKHTLESNAFYDQLGYINDGYDLQIEMLDNTIKKMYGELDDLIAILGFKERYDNLLTCPGIGPKVGKILTIFFIEMLYKGFQKSDSKKVKKYSGLCPNQRQSGESLNKTKIIKKGNKFVRYNISFSSMNWKCNLEKEQRKDTTIAKFGLRMKQKFEAGNKKGGLSTNCAIANKLIGVTWAMFCDNKAYEHR